MTTWTKQKLGDVCDLQQGLAINRKSKHLIVNKSSLALLRITDLINDKQVQYIDTNLIPPQFIADEESLIYTRTGQVGLVFKNKKGVVHNNCFKIIPKNTLDKNFLYYVLKQKSLYDHVVQIASKSAQPDLTHTAFKSVIMDMPNDISTQINIASVISAYDNLIENNEKRIKILEEMAKRLYTEWFVKFKFPGHEKVKIVDSPLGKMPDGWEVKKIEDVCSKITDGSHWSPKTVDAGYPMASVKDMNSWGFDIEPCRKISEADYAKLVKNDCKPKIDDVLIAKDGSYLKHVFIVNKEIDLVILSSIAILRPNDKLLPELLRLYLLEPNIKSRMKSYVSGAALPRIILDSFRKFPIIVPLLSVQQEFNNIISSRIKLRNSLLDTNNRSVRIRDLLIPQLATGKRILKV